MIRLDGVSMRFGQVVALRGIHVSFATGATSVLIGPSGCGKSTVPLPRSRLRPGKRESSGPDARTWACKPPHSR